MPEGHLYHRLARNLSEFSGGELAACSPQGRFSEGAAQLNGTRLEVAEAPGKHLLVRFAGGRTVHIHLGMRGKLLACDLTRRCAESAVDRGQRAEGWVDCQAAFAVVADFDTVADAPGHEKIRPRRIAFSRLAP